jgi:methylmalonyl-CoA/ethylmalonyl-CoA epimerase
VKINKFDHICVAVRDLDAARARWEPLLGKTAPDDAYVDEPEKITVARYWLGEVGFELMAPTAPDSEVAKFIERRGEGVMLLGFNVDDTRTACAELDRQGYPLLGAPRRFRDCEYNFVHPSALNGVLVEVIDYRWPEFDARSRADAAATPKRVPER